MQCGVFNQGELWVDNGRIPRILIRPILNWTSILRDVMRTFEDFVAGVVPDPKVWHMKMSNFDRVNTDYVILFGARTGSTWLTHLLRRLLGHPDEYLNPDFLAGNAERLGTTNPIDFMKAIRSASQTGGVFGIEATCEHIAIFGEDRFFKVIERPVVFHLWRENLVAQSVSIYRAVKTGHFHSTEGKAPPDPEYIPSELENWYRYMARVENGNVELLQRREITPINLTYETIFKDARKTLQLFHDSLTRVLPHVDDVKNQVEKLGSDWNSDAEKHFRQSHAELVGSTEDSRLVRRLGMVSVLAG